MPTWLTYIWLTPASLVALYWLIRLANMGRIIRKRQILGSSSYDAPLVPAPKLSVIVAAKDEEDNIASCVRSLLDQNYPDFELIAVNDRSEDRTPAILDQLAKEAGGRLTVVTIQTVRDGWFGKNNAMREGVAISSGDWLLFTDADCRQISQNTLTVAMGEVMDKDVDFLSITPVLETHSVWERVIQPVCTLVLMIWFLPHRVNKPKRKTAYANGAFMLMRRTCYEKIGGHHRVRAEVNEDIQMARTAKGMGLRLRVVENDDLYRTRMYDTLLAAWNGWSRIYYGSMNSLGHLALAAFLVAVLSIMPWVGLAVALLGYALADVGSGASWLTAVGAWTIAVLLEQVTTWRTYGILRVHPVWSLTYVLGAVVALGMLVSAMLKRVGATSTTWRGTTYRGGKLEGKRATPPANQPIATEPAEKPATP